MIKVCFFSGDITRSGGTERVAVMIANALAADSSVKVCFLSLVEQKEAPFFELAPVIEHYALGNKWLSPGPAYLPLIPKVRRFLKEHEIQVIIDIDIVLDVLSVPAAKGLKTRVISWEHSNCEYELSIFYRRMIIKHFTSRSDWIVTLTPGDAESFRKLMKRQDRIDAVYNPVNEPSIEPREREKRVITVARLVPGKGFDLLAEVAKKVLPAHPEWKWYICGDGPEREFMENFCRENHFEDRIILTGLVPAVDEYLAKSRLFVLTSSAVGLPMCLLEARTYGVPCVSFDIPTGLADIIQDGKNGYLIPPFDCDAMAEKMNQLLSDEKLLDEMSREAGQGLEMFYMPRIIGQWKEILEKLSR